MDGWIETLTDPNIIVAVLVSMAVLATFYSLVAPLLERGDLAKRMKSVATEREQIRARERARLNTEAPTGRASLRTQHNSSVREVVERLNLRKALVDDNTVNRLKTAGFRSQNALNTFLFARFCLPFLFLTVSVLYIFGLGNFADKPVMVRVSFAIGFAYVGFYAPNIFIANAISKRQHSIRRAWPDALDLLLICVESGVSMELAMRRVADEIAVQSQPLAEELVLTTAELSFLPERRVALEIWDDARASKR